MGKEKLRQYEYLCRRCGKRFDDDCGYPSDAVENHIMYIAVDDQAGLKRLMGDYPDFIDSPLGSFHVCNDEGVGIGDLMGCSEEYEHEGVE